MSRNYKAEEKLMKARRPSGSKSDVKSQQEDFKPLPPPRKTINNAEVVRTAVNFIQNVSNKNLSNKSVIPPILSGYNAQDSEVIDQSFLPLKLFDGKKQSLSELNEESMSYLWLRRIKEIFLRMADGKDGRDDDRFVEFDMELAKIDLVITCDRYIENERLALSKKKTKTVPVGNSVSSPGSLDDIQQCIKELNNLISNPSSEGLSTLLNQCITSLETFDKNTQKILSDIRRRKQENNIELDPNTILRLMKPLQSVAVEEEKSDLDIKQEWDMKKLYAEVFKMSYKRNPLKTEIEQEDLTPKKKGDDQPNFGNAIWWYSCDKANIYYQINSILRLENFELLMSYRYYLSDLCRMIEYMYQKRKDEHGDIMQTFYRSGHINTNQLQKMEKQQKGQLISLVGFISATTDIEIAKGYARKQHVSVGNERVLFEIVIKPQEPCTSFAYIDGISFHPEEKEVLFSMGSTFAVEEVFKPQQGENFYRVRLIATDIDKTLVDDIRAKIEKNTPSGRAVLLAQYLMELGEYRATRKYLNSLLAQAGEEGILFNDPSLASMYTCLGMTYARQGLFGDAIKSFKQALNTQARLEYSNNNVLASIHNQIGLAYVGLGHLDEAEETLSEAIRIQIRELNSNQQHLAAIYSNMGYVHYKKNNLDKAQSVFNEAEKIYKKKTSKIAHDELEQSLIQAEHLTNYGHFLSMHKSSVDAQEKYNDALKLYKKIVPEHDPKLMQTHINIMLAYAQNKKYDEVIKWFTQPIMDKLIKKQETNMFELNSSVTQSSLAFLYEFIGACYAKQEDFDSAIRMWTCALLFNHKARLEELLFETTNSTFTTLILQQKNFIKNGYQVALEHYDTKETENISLSKDFCIGLLHAELHNRDKAIEYLKGSISHLTELKSDMLYIAQLLLADIFRQQRKYEDAVKNYDATLKFINSSKTKDRDLEIAIELARSECSIEINSKDIIPHLNNLANSLNANDSDTKRISLQVIVYDTLAKCCLKQGAYELFDMVAEESMSLKLRNFSQYHPSLAINLVQIAERLIQLLRYREALDFYEHALEVQSLNLADNHPKIRKIFYSMGDIYCKLDKLSMAIEKYDVAESKSSDSDDNDVAEKLNSEDSMDISMARCHMYQQLADCYAKKQSYKESIMEMNKILDLLKEKLPPSAFNYNDDTTLMNNKIDSSILINNLQQLVNCYLNQGDEDSFKIALDICEKLFQHDNELVKKQHVSVYHKLSLYYEDEDENEDALDYLQKSTKCQQPTVSTLYRLAQLNLKCDEYNEALTIYTNLLEDDSIKNSSELSLIIQKKLQKIREKSKKARRRSSTTSSSFDDSISDEETSKHSSVSIVKRTKSSMSAQSHAESESNRDDTTNYRAMAFAYYQLGDSDMCMKYHEKYTKKDTSNDRLFSEQQKPIMEQSYHYENDDAISVLPILFRGLNQMIRNADNLEKSEVLDKADSFFQCGEFYKQKSYYLESVNAYISAFSLYLSKSLTDTSKLIEDVNNLLNIFVKGDLDCKDIIKVSTQYLSTNVTECIRIKTAALYRDDEIYDIEDLDGDGNTSNESRIMALAQYRDLLKETKDPMVKGVCYFNILNLYKDHIYEDDHGKRVVEDMLEVLPKYTSSDRRVLLQLAVHFMAEYDTNTGNCDMKINRQLQKIEKDYYKEKLKIDDGKCIGKYLIECDDIDGAEKYWNLIIEQTENNIPYWIRSLIRDPDSIFDDILQTINQPENDTVLLLNQLVSTYESLGDYYMLDAKNNQTTGTNCFQQAEIMYKNAVHLLNRLKADSEKITKIKMKQEEATSQITTKSKMKNLN